MRKALVVGIDYYAHGGSLTGCVNDAYSVKSMLDRHGDGSVNFDVKLLVSNSASANVERAELKDAITDLFSDDSDIALLYFAGHGHMESVGGYILASDSKRGDDGVPLHEILQLANASAAKNKIVILDSCHSGIAGDHPATSTTELKEGLTILTASTAEQYADEENGHGVFTSLLVDALSGSASNLLGEITPGSVYAHIDQSLGPWAQRPVFKTNVKRFVSLRTVPAPVSLSELHRLLEFFPKAGAEFQLDPSFEPERSADQSHLPPPDPENTLKFSILQKFNRVNLVVPVAAPHMWHAAIESKTCKLTALGEHYRRLVEKDRI